MKKLLTITVLVLLATSVFAQEAPKPAPAKPAATASQLTTEQQHEQEVLKAFVQAMQNKLEFIKDLQKTLAKEEVLVSQVIKDAVTRHNAIVPVPQVPKK